MYAAARHSQHQQASIPQPPSPCWQPCAPPPPSPCPCCCWPPWPRGRPPSSWTNQTHHTHSSCRRRRLLAPKPAGQITITCMVFGDGPTDMPQLITLPAPKDTVRLPRLLCLCAPACMPCSPSLCQLCLPCSRLLTRRLFCACVLNAGVRALPLPTHERRHSLPAPSRRPACRQVEDCIHGADARHVQRPGKAASGLQGRALLQHQELQRVRACRCRLLR